jgi:glycosyltransferase involved in cell wall biosynthesis
VARIAFNAQLLSYGQWYRSAGISRYLDRTLHHLAPYLEGETSLAFVGPAVPADAPSLKWLTVARTRLPTQRPLVRIAWEQLALPLALQRWQADLLHAPAYVAPLASSVRQVVTFHDLSFYRLPEAFNRTNRIYLQTFARLTARRAQRLIAVSEFTRQELRRLLGVPLERVAVVPNGVDPRFRPETDPAVLAAFRARAGLPDRFILYLGTLEPRKNLPALLRGYARARQQGVREPLVIAGGRGWGDTDLARLVEQLVLTDAVRLVGFVPMSEQPLWYNAATLFAYPSRYEGFGLPPLEAMACGTAVVTSDRSSLPEVVGDAGVLVDPDDPEALAAALVRLLGDDGRRQELGRRGQARARAFTWEAAAAATARVYRATLNGERV